MLTEPIKPLRMTTWFGRHWQAMDHIKKEFSGTESPVVAWVIGVGGRRAYTFTPGFSPSEHLEVALALQNGGVRDFQVHVFDRSSEAVSMAREQLGVDTAESHSWPQNNDITFANNGEWQYGARWYVERVTGQSLENPYRPVKLLLPEDVRKKITVHSSEHADPFKTVPNARPDVVTCFNIAQYYGSDEQEKFADKLVDQLKEGGLIVANRVRGNFRFINRLKERLDARELGKVAHYPDHIWAFQKPKK